ncbi:hypothetical protein [Pseudorhodoplanes sp.]|uniref:hypothetical protein n=1 Tax=Pseudorhodoplanes sp. TaxID=1934341 RepID=UPI002D7F44A5|nr:hypothetical protein [Pseudorhodoplanes sp.]
MTTSMQGYADRQLPTKPISHIVAYVAAPSSLSSSIQVSIATEAKKHGIVAEDALTLFPPTRSYTNEEIKQSLASNRVDGVLTINVGDSGILQQYAGTYFQAQTVGDFSARGTVTNFGNMSTVSLGGTSSTRTSGTATPIYRYSRQTAFVARLIEPGTGRNLWVGNGQVRAGGLLFVGDGTSASSSISAIFNDLQNKGLIDGTS